MNKQTAVRARWVVPVTSPPIENGLVTISAGKIERIEANASSVKDELDLGNNILLPGLVNSHCHLEFSDLKRPLGKPGIKFTDWIPLVVKERISNDPEFSKSAAIKMGIRESVDSGVAYIGEITTAPTDVNDYHIDSIRTIVFHELLGRNDNQRAEKLRQFDATRLEFESSSIDFGISPHAPYSVGPLLFEDILAQAQVHQLPLAMHLAESKEELELLANVDGPFAELLQRLNAWHPETYQAGKRPLDYLKALSNHPRSLIVHGNYLDEEEIDFVADSDMSIAYCPRTHAYFDHDEYPLKDLLARKINVCLGTDSRASNPDLSLLGEMKEVKRCFPDLDGESIVRLATHSGAVALGIDNRCGAIEKGKDAALSVALTTVNNASDPFNAILKSGSIQPLEKYISKSRILD